MIGIYKITNNLSGKIYIGQSNNIERRWKEHCASNRWKTSENYIDVAIHKYGKENFSLEVLEECDVAQLNEREQYWIAYYNTYKGNGYNATSGGKDRVAYQTLQQILWGASYSNLPIYRKKEKKWINI